MQRLEMSFKAAAAMAQIGVAVEIDTTDTTGQTVKVAAGATSMCIGILMTVAATAGDQVRVCVFGECYGAFNTSCAVGAHISAVAAGGLLGEAAATYYPIGIVLETVAAQNDLKKIYVNPTWTVHA